MKDRAQLQGVEHGPYVVEVFLVDAAGLVFLTAERLDLVDAGEVVLELAVQFAHFLLRNAEVRPDLFGKDHAGDQNEGDRRAGDEREFRVDGEQDDEHPCEGHEMRDRLGNDVRVEQLEIAGVVHDAAHQVTGLLVVEIAEMHVFELVVDFCPEVADQIPGRLVRHVAAHEAEGNAQKIESDQDQREAEDLLPAFFGDAPLHDPRHGGQGFRRRKVDGGESQGR